MQLETKKQLSVAKKLIQAKQYDKAREILWNVDDEIATKWLMRLDEMDSSPELHSQPKAKVQSVKANQLQIIKIAIVAIGFVIIGIFAISLVVERQMIDTQIAELDKAIDDAGDYCRSVGYRGADFSDCLDKQMASFHCREFVEAELDSCLMRELPSLFEELEEMETRFVATFTPIGYESIGRTSLPSTWTPTPQPQNNTTDGRATPNQFIPPTQSS